MPPRNRGPWGYLVGRTLVTAVVASSIVELTAQSVTAKPARVDRWPCRIVAASAVRKAFEQGWERSTTIRGQCEELAAAQAVVVLEWGAMDSQSHALTRMAVREGVVVATVTLPPIGDTLVLLAHELQHVIEQTRGLDFAVEAKRAGSGVWVAFGGYETQAAVDVSTQVAKELRAYSMGARK